MIILIYNSKIFTILLYSSGVVCKDLIGYNTIHVRRAGNLKRDVYISDRLQHCLKIKKRATVYTRTWHVFVFLFFFSNAIENKTSTPVRRRR